MSFQSLLRNLPVSVNNLADPAILRESTAAKLDALAADGHTGPVALITKGNLGIPWWRDRLPGWADNLNLFVFSSISGLPREIEPVPEAGRWATLQAAREAGAKAICYHRPIIHTVNDSRELIARLYRQAKDSGAHAIVSSGFRGDDGVVQAAGVGSVPAPDGQHWSPILKLTPQATAEFMREAAARVDLPYWTRTQCAVAALSQQQRGLNPYHMAPKFVDCTSCPIQASCQGTAQFHQPRNGSIELLRYVGFEVTVHTASERYRSCDVQLRQECELCCTNCPVAPANYGVPWVQIRRHDGSHPSWGDMSFARFITGGMLCTDPTIPPGERSEVGLHPRFNIPDGQSGHGSLYGVNSWMIWSEYLPREQCFNCQYCFLDMKRFQAELPMYSKTVGTSPVRILDWEQQTCSSFTKVA